MHLGTVEDLMTIPLMHDTPDEMAVTGGVVKDWKAGEVDLIPGVTAPKFILCERDYTAIGAKMSALGPLLETVGTVTKGVAVKTAPEYELAQAAQRCDPGGSGRRSPGASSTHRRRARRSSRCPAPPTAGSRWRASATSRSAPASSSPTSPLDNEGKRITFADTQARPVPVITSPEWSGSEHGGRRYTAFTINVERLEAVAHAHRSPAPVPRPRLDDRDRRAVADVPAAVEHASPLRRSGHRRRA
ncbi:MAG: hypothetical protein V9G10_05060 [Candidatus Nanopelagicales bacterium]